MRYKFDLESGFEVKNYPRTASPNIPKPLRKNLRNGLVKIDRSGAGLGSVYRFELENHSRTEPPNTAQNDGT